MDSEEILKRLWILLAWVFLFSNQDVVYYCLPWGPYSDTGHKDRVEVAHLDTINNWTLYRDDNGYNKIQKGLE